MSFQPVLAADTLDVGKVTTVVVDGRPIIISHTEDGFFAMDDLCTHNGARLGGGKIRKNTVSCPVHGARFDLKTGICLAKALGCPAIVTHELRVVDGQIEVAVSSRPVQQPLA